MCPHRTWAQRQVHKEVSYSHGFLHPVTQQTTQVLFWARHYSRCWGRRSKLVTPAAAGHLVPVCCALGDALLLSSHNSVKQSRRHR